MSDAEDDDVDLASVASEEEDVAPDVDGDKWVLFNNGSESTAWLQVLYGLGFANSLDYNKHDFYFVQYQRVDGGAPKFVLFGVKRKEDEFAQIDSVAEVDVTSALLQSLQRSEYFMLNLSDEAQICINVLLSAFNMRPNDMNRNTTQLILRLRRKIQTHIKDCFYEKMLSEVAYKMEDGDNYEESNFETEDKDTIEYYEGYVRVHLSVDRLCKRMQALVIADKKTADEIEKSELAEAERKLESERAETTRLTRELEVKNSENTSLKSTNETLSKENEKIARLETTVASLQSEKTEIEKAKNVLESNVSNLEAQNFGLRLQLTSRPADVSGEETGGEDAVGGAAGAGETGRTGAEDPAKASAGGGETGRTEAESHRKATEDASAENKRVDSEAKEATAKRKAYAERPAAVSGEETGGEGAKNADVLPKADEPPQEELPKSAADKAAEKLQDLQKTIEEANTTINRENTEKILKNIDACLFNDDLTADMSIKLKEKLSILNNNDEQKNVDIDMKTLTQIVQEPSAHKAATFFYYQLTRMQQYKIPELKGFEDIYKNLKVSRTEDESTENFTIVVPSDDEEGKPALNILKQTSGFIQCYVFEFLLQKDTKKKNNAAVAVNSLLNQRVLNNSANGQQRTAENLKQILGFDFPAMANKNEQEKEIFKTSTLKLDMNPVPVKPTAKVIQSHSQQQQKMDESTGSGKSRSKIVLNSCANYSPSPAYETACAHDVQFTQAPKYLPIGFQNARYYTGYMY
jgi:hypothetical protein